MNEIIYKIMSRASLAEARKAGPFDGSADDLRDGFIHLSTGPQVAGTLEKHFPGEADLVLLAVETTLVGDRLKWEPSRGGDLFPHLYAPLELDNVLWIKDLPLGEDGRHQIPPEVAS
jgi:uncharacterized protein (DUF952 family)